jgi:hypothetical protein
LVHDYRKFLSKEIGSGLASDQAFIGQQTYGASEIVIQNGRPPLYDGAIFYEGNVDDSAPAGLTAPGWEHALGGLTRDVFWNDDKPTSIIAIQEGTGSSDMIVIAMTKEHSAPRGTVLERGQFLQLLTSQYGIGEYAISDGGGSVGLAVKFGSIGQASKWRYEVLGPRHSRVYPGPFVDFLNTRVNNYIVFSVE